MVHLKFSLIKANKNLTEAARIAFEMGSLANQLAQIQRTRVTHIDGRAENDAEHSLMLAKVAPELVHILYPTLDENLVARFAALHDDVEAYVGDTPTDAISNHNQQAKDQLEQVGMSYLTKDFASMPRYVALLEQYEAQSVPEARFVRAVDKLMVLLIHFYNGGAVIKENYTYDSFLKFEDQLLERDGYKYGEFDLVKQLRHELALELANSYLSD